MASPTVGLVYFLVIVLVLLLASWIMGKFEGHRLATYGLPWKRAFCGQFWQAAAISFVSLTLLLAILRLAKAYCPWARHTR
jgi:hypothetical protein